MPSKALDDLPADGLQETWDQVASDTCPKHLDLEDRYEEDAPCSENC